jgi:hypothetical protein
MLLRAPKIPRKARERLLEVAPEYEPMATRARTRAIVKCRFAK